MYRESGEEPAKTTENQGFNETNDVKELPTLGMNAIACKKDGDGAIDGNAECEEKKPTSGKRIHVCSYYLPTLKTTLSMYVVVNRILPVTKPNTIINVWAMMIKLCNASVTYSAMLGSKRPHHPTGVTEA